MGRCVPRLSIGAGLALLLAFTIDLPAQSPQTPVQAPRGVVEIGPVTLQVNRTGSTKLRSLLPAHLAPSLGKLSGFVIGSDQHFMSTTDAGTARNALQELSAQFDEAVPLAISIDSDTKALLDRFHGRLTFVSDTIRLERHDNSSGGSEWILPAGRSRLLVVTYTIDPKYSSSKNCAGIWITSEDGRLVDSLGRPLPLRDRQEVLEDWAACGASYLLFRTDDHRLVEAAEVGSSGLDVNATVMTQDPSSRFTVNDYLTLRADRSPLIFGPSHEPWRITWDRVTKSCRAESSDPADHAAAVLPSLLDFSELHPVSNGIMVGAGKIFDTLTLRRMLAETSNQLAAITGFNGSVLTSALTNLQGVTRDTSFVAAQLTTVPTPSVTNTTSTGGTGNTGTTATSSTPGVTTTVVTLQCPDGTIPSAGTACTAAAKPAGTESTSTSNVTTNNPSTTQQTNSAGTTQQSSTTTTTPSLTVSVPSAPTSTAFAAPGSIGLASADILAEQVQLNAQITTLRLLLQGAASDQYLVRNSHAVATRQQTTLGFAVSLDPPRELRHAVAEVRVVLVPPPDPSGANPSGAISIMNLLPSEKTYNVATITSHQNSFGAGVVVQPVSIGAATGRARDRLYLAKDTDTLALQFHPASVHTMGRPLPQVLHDTAKSIADFVAIGSCQFRDGIEQANAVAFGWQFRPVLGADYVKGGQRQVFAQLALPTSLEANYEPDIYIQTSWREYDPKRQVVGATYKATCSKVSGGKGVALLNSPRVHEVRMDDLGNGQLRLSASGEFFSSGVSVVAGLSTAVPATYDGRSVDLFGNAHDLLEAGNLTIVGPNGVSSPFAIPVNEDTRRSSSCGIAHATAVVAPRGDGNSLVTLTIETGATYRSAITDDGPLKPLVLIGNTVYGIREHPFLQPFNVACQDQAAGASCRYDFIAPTAELRNAQTFLVRDLAWDLMKYSGPLEFSPSVSALTVLQADSAPSPAAAPIAAKGASSKGAVPGGGSPPLTTVYSVTGYDLKKITGRADCDRAAREQLPCLQVFLGNTPVVLSADVFSVSTNNVATLTLPQDRLKDVKSIRFRVRHDQGDERVTEWAFPVKAADDKPTASPAYLHVGDSRKVTFSGASFSSIDPKKVAFENHSLVAIVSTDGKSLDVYVTSAVTRTSGHKELTAASTDPKSKPLSLSIEVVK